MSQRANFFIVAAYGLVALAVAALLHYLAALDGALSIMIGAVIFLISAQIHAAAVHAHESEVVSGEITDLRSANTVLQAELEEARDEMQELARSYEERSRSHTSEIRAEMRVLETFVQELADGIAEKAVSSGAMVSVPADAPAAEAEEEAASAAYLKDLGNAELLDLVQRSLEENRVDLYLQPIVSLPQRRVLHFEGFTRLRTGQGDLIKPEQYLPVAETAGLMSIIDNLLLFRCVQVVRQLTERHREASIFCNISNHSLKDRAFFPQFLEFLRHNRDLSRALVFEFGQETIEKATRPELDNLATLTALGFHFSLDKVSHLDLDPRLLRDRDFRYLKVPAELLLRGMNTAKARFSAEDLKMLLSRYGIELIAEKIEDERTVIDVIDQDVRLGQGFLFGRPRPIREVHTKPAEKPVRRAG
ncbi:MAG: EAL domain-containing protein [Alphaproteobacteria bacterium]|nr:EAL domain-containing protein [Alphaproteobacteria bacterium]